MAKKIETRLIDDIDGSRANSTVTFGLDGMPYEIDLSDRHLRQLRRLLQPYIDAGRRRSGPGRRGRRRSS